MKKHILGLALFTIIVGAAAIVYGFLNVPQIIPVPAPQYISTTTTTLKTSCWRMKRAHNEFRANSIEVRQAVLDVPTKQFNWELALPESNEPIELHFFVKNDKETRYITSEQVKNKFSNNGELKFSDSYDWLNKRKSLDNLYVIAQFESEATNYNENFEVYGDKFQPKFDVNKATAVTVDYGK
jgi:hypothetical protein